MLHIVWLSLGLLAGITVLSIAMTVVSWVGGIVVYLVDLVSRKVFNKTLL